MTDEEMWERFGPELRRMLAEAPPLSPDQVRDLRSIGLSIITRTAERKEDSR
jgi:hypothetical protein